MGIGSALARQAAKRVRKTVRPKARQLDLDPLVEGTPLYEGGRSRAGPTAEQTGREIPLLPSRPARNLGKRAAEVGRQQGGEDARIEALKIAGAGAGAVAVAGSLEGIKRLLMSDSAASKNFKIAFADARKNGKRTFTWRNRKYTTQTVAEVAGLKRRLRRKPTPPARKAHGGMQSKKRTGHIDLRKGGLFYKKGK